MQESMKYTDIMIDIETLDTKPSSVILSIAAQAFNIHTGELCPEDFYERMEYKNQVNEGRTVSIETALWWGQQSDEAIEHAFTGQANLSWALKRLEEYFLKYGLKEHRVWAKSPAFDLTILKDALIDQTVFWGYTDERDVRTYTWGVPIVGTRTHYVITHIAIQDVLKQIKEVCQVYKSLHPHVETN